MYFFYLISENFKNKYSLGVAHAPISFVVVTDKYLLLVSLVDPERYTG
jgi:hypothetical protein